MAKKILFCASTLSHIKNFHLPYLQAFHDMGYEVHVACNQKGYIPYADQVFVLPFQKSFASVKNLLAVLLARRLLAKENYSVISLHTTLASVIMRVGVLSLRKKPFVVNTVHGYLFGAKDPLFKKWVYLLPEKLCAPATDITMVMNQEDYFLCEKYRLYGQKLYKIPGMGVDANRFRPRTEKIRDTLRKKHGFSDRDFVFTYAAEFSKRKNQTFLLNAFIQLAQEQKNAHLLLCGSGKLLEDCKKLAAVSPVKKQIHFLGQVKDIEQVYLLSDACVSVSKSEGLPFAVMEAAFCGLPVIASGIKGHNDFIQNDVTGLLYPPGDMNALLHCMESIMKNPFIRKKLPKNATENLHAYSLAAVKEQIMHIYQENLSRR